MPEAMITLDKVFAKPGETNGRQWTRYDLRPAEDGETRYSTFSDSIGGKAQEWQGAKVRVTYEETDRGNKISELALVGPPPDKSAESRSDSGTKMAEHPDTQRAIRAAVALEWAVTSVQHTIPMDADVDVVSAKVSPLARRYYLLLTELAADEGEIPF